MTGGLSAAPFAAPIAAPFAAMLTWRLSAKALRAIVGTVIALIGTFNLAHALA